jgi:hypothetical protein
VGSQSRPFLSVAPGNPDTLRAFQILHAESETANQTSGTVVAESVSMVRANAVRPNARTVGAFFQGSGILPIYMQIAAADIAGRHP